MNRSPFAQDVIVNEMAPLSSSSPPREWSSHLPRWKRVESGRRCPISFVGDDDDRGKEQEERGGSIFLCHGSFSIESIHSATLNVHGRRAAC